MMFQLGGVVREVRSVDEMAVPMESYEPSRVEVAPRSSDRAKESQEHGRCRESPHWCWKRCQG